MVRFKNGSLFLDLSCMSETRKSKFVPYASLSVEFRKIFGTVRSYTGSVFR